MNNDVLDLDEYDKQIIHLLQEDATISNKALAAKINLAPSSCLMRVKALVNSGIIKKTIAIVDEKILGYQITAFLRVELKNINKASIDGFLNIVLQYEQVLQCYMITGGGQFLLKIIAKNLEDYRDFLINKLTSIENVGNVESSLVMNVEKNSDYIPV